MALAALSSSSPTIKFGGTAEATAVATAGATGASAVQATTAATGYDELGTGVIKGGKEREMDGNTETSCGSSNLSDSIMSVTASTSTATAENMSSVDSVAQLTSTDDILLDELSSRFRGVLPIQPSPLLLPSDHISSSLKSTRLNGHLIYCFVIGGECRLCFPQIISVVLRGVAINDINELFVDLNIHISVASQQQLDTLKLAGVMPMTADSCGLVTKSDAERLVAKLLPQCSGYRLRTDVAASYGTDTIPVMHDCFDGCTGTLIPMLDTDEQIECTQCKLLFTGEKFVSHSHSIQQIRRICHWGFDSSNWRHYLHLPESYEDDIKALQNLNYINIHRYVLANVPLHMLLR
ncbi:Ski oncogene [Dirofilaria immitis]|nr:Ski oncogene [Dirofilaria immitis]